MRRIHRNLDVLLECMQSSLKVGVSEILMPNVSHPAFWSGPYQNSSVFPGCLGLDLIFTGTCFVYGAMLTAEKVWSGCVSHFGGRPVYLSVCVGDTTGHLMSDVCTAQGHSSLTLWKQRTSAERTASSVVWSLRSTFCMFFGSLKQTQHRRASNQYVQCQL